MSVEKEVMLLLLLAVIGTYADHHDCHGLTTKLPETDLHKIVGDWVMVWSVSMVEQDSWLWSNLTSSYTEIRLLPDNHTINFAERHMFHNSSCINFYINMTTDESHNHTLHAIGGMMEINGVFSPDNKLEYLDFYESCPDCLVIVWSAEDDYLIVYKKYGEHRDAELLKAAHSNHTKLAKCLGFPHNKAFHYDGVADLCPKK